jgi:peptide-methionine (R)-S-oxide reductase
MKLGTRIRFLGAALVLTVVAGWALGQDGTPSATQTVPDRKPTEAEASPTLDRVTKSDAEWRRILTPMQYMVTRRKATEPPWSGIYARSHAKGVFTCVCCGAPLFSSNHKFQSGTGWPSFYRPIDPARLATEMDYSNPFEARVEVMCARCGAHLGHVFQDGPPPTGLRFCINSVALKLEPFLPASKSTAAKKASKTSSEAKPAPAADPPTADQGSTNDRPAAAPAPGP